MIEKYLSGKASHTEQQLIATYLERLEKDNELTPQGDPAEREHRIWTQIAATTGRKENSHPLTTQRVHFIKTAWFRYAAAIIILFGIGAYLWITNNNTQHPIVAQQTIDIAPGKDGAILTLADGSQVILDSLGNGVIATQNGSQAVIKNGELVYDITGEAGGEIVYNTMSTPKGRQFNLSLPDGTKVWLNAASSIRYPTVFTGKERKVEVNGEAYFEVARNMKMPFRVNVNNKAEVEVLGTHFNVNGYPNESAINTTLLEGSVRVNRTTIKPDQQAQGRVNDQPPVVSPDRSAVTLKPGQQAQIDNQLVGQQEIRIVSNVDIEKVMAWKNGLFNFEDLGLEQVMRQLERWYDIEVVFEKDIPNIRFWGKMTKDVSLSGLLIGLEGSGVHFKVEGRKLIVLP